jgi:hypothetical protein
MSLFGEKKPLYRVKIVFKSGHTETFMFEEFEFKAFPNSVESLKWKQPKNAYPRLMDVCLSEIAALLEEEP